MNMKETELIPGFRRSHMAKVKGERTRHVVTMNPNKANPGEELYIDIPKMKMDSCLIPGSLHLLFTFKVSNTKSWFLNNLSKMLQKRLKIRLAGETVYDNNAENIHKGYKDLWKSNSQRLDMTEYGIASKNIRKLISKDDSGATSGDAQNSIYGNKQKICLDKIICNHGVYAPYFMNNNFHCDITLPVQAS